MWYEVHCFSRGRMWVEPFGSSSEAFEFYLMQLEAGVDAELIEVPCIARSLSSPQRALALRFSVARLPILEARARG